MCFQIGDPPQGNDLKVKKLSRIHIDMGFGDPIENVPKKQLMTSILAEGTPISWSVYPLEYIFAEKLEALFSRGSANSRAKDIYDMPLVFSKIQNKQSLLKAIVRTFTHRKTPIPNSFVKAANAFDLTIMRRAWPSVELLDDSKSFEQYWNETFACLKLLDSIHILET